MNKKSYQFILFWVFFWGFNAAVMNFVLKRSGINFLDGFQYIIIFYIALTYLGIYLFNGYDLLSKSVIKKNSLFGSGAALVSFIVVSFILGMIFWPDEGQIEKLYNMGFYYPLFKYQSTLAKTFDILHQQVMIVIFVTKLQRYKLSPLRIINITTVVFFVLHIPLLLIFSSQALYFIIPSAIAGGVFSILIMKEKKGVAISVATHCLFYILLGIGMRL